MLSVSLLDQVYRLPPLPPTSLRFEYWKIWIIEYLGNIWEHMEAIFHRCSLIFIDFIDLGGILEAFGDIWDAFGGIRRLLEGMGPSLGVNFIDFH